MKILHVIDHMGLGGAQKLLRDILPELEKNIEGEIHLFVLRDDINEKYPEILHVLNARSFFCNPFVFFKVLRYIRIQNIDVLHLHLQRSVFAGLVASLLTTVKIVVHIHSDIEHELFYFRFILRLFKKKVAYFIVGSMRMVDQVLHVLKVDEWKINPISSFINTNKFNRCHYNSTTLRMKNGFSQTDFIIGYFGRLSREKQPWHVINIANLLSKKSEKFKFIIAGTGLFRNRLENMIKKQGLQKTVYLLGYREDMPELMSIINLGIFTSSYEGFPVSAIEMMSMGKPIIAFHIPAFEEIIENGVNGYMIKMGDVKSFCNQLQDIYNDANKLKKLGDKAIETVKPFDIQTACNRYIDLYKKLE